MRSCEPSTLFPTSLSTTGLSLILVLLPQSLNDLFAVGIEEFLSALLPCRLHLRRGDVPIGAAFLEDYAQVLAQVFQCGTPEKPVAASDKKGQCAQHHCDIRSSQKC